MLTLNEDAMILDSEDDYLEITSKGEIDNDSFLIMGGSTKRDDEDKIGRFGSGLKYAIATLLTYGNSFHVFSGEREVDFSIKRKFFRSEAFDMICVDDEETNFSTQMGPDWDMYDAIRDIYANAVDEELDDFQTTNRPAKTEGYTKFYIEITEEVEDIIDNFNRYFSINRDDIVQEYNGITVFESIGHLVVYKDGFKVYENEDKKSLFNYDISNLKINESREITSSFDLKWKVRRLILKNANSKLASIFVKHAKEIGEDGESEMWEFNEINYDLNYSDPSEAWKDHFEGSLVMPKEASEFLSGKDLHKEYDGADNISRVPSSFASTLSSSGYVNSVGNQSDLCPHQYTEVGGSSGDYDKILQCKQLLIRMDLDMEGIGIQIVRFRKSTVRSSFDKRYSSKEILLSKDLFSDSNPVKLKAQLIKQVVAMKEELKINSVSHINQLAEFFVETLESKPKTKI